MTVASPCTGICRLDDATGWCLGCGRNGAEIADWGTHPDAWRQSIWSDIPDRLAHLGVSYRRLPWTTGDIRDFVVQSLETARGAWVMGVVGAVAEFAAGPGTRTQVSVDGDHLVARTRNGALRMVLNDDVRALTFDPPTFGTDHRIVLAVKRERRRVPLAKGIAPLGRDQGALLPDEGGVLYDLGLGRREARFCVRVQPGQAQKALDRAAGMPFPEGMPQIGAALVQESPTRIVETTLGQIEVQGRIPAPDARSPVGPHTHLVPEDVATGRALPVGMDLPRSYAPGAVFYPGR